MKFPEQYRWLDAPRGYTSKMGDPAGVFIIQKNNGNHRGLKIVAVDGAETGWEHVSVSLIDTERCPNWPEMCLVKNLFWEPSECVVQFHPPEKDYINDHPGVLHMWKHVDVPFPLPPTILV